MEKEARREAEGAESELSFEIGSWMVMEGSDRFEDVLNDLDRKRGEGSDGKRGRRGSGRGGSGRK